MHGGVASITRVIRMAQTGTLKDTPVVPALKALEKMQVREPGAYREGGFRWYWEEPHPAETNAAFFISLSLLILAKTRGEELHPDSRQQLHSLFPPLQR